MRASTPAHRRRQSCRTSGRSTCLLRGRPDHAALRPARAITARSYPPPCRFRRRSSGSAAEMPARWRSAHFRSAARRRHCQPRCKTPAPASKPSWESPCLPAAFRWASYPFCFPSVPVPWTVFSSFPSVKPRASNAQKKLPSNRTGAAISHSPVNSKLYVTGKPGYCQELI